MEKEILICYFLESATRTSRLRLVEVSSSSSLSDKTPASSSSSSSSLSFNFLYWNRGGTDCRSKTENSRSRREGSLRTTKRMTAMTAIITTSTAVRAPWPLLLELGLLLLGLGWVVGRVVFPFGVGGKKVVVGALAQPAWHAKHDVQENL